MREREGGRALCIFRIGMHSFGQITGKSELMLDIWFLCKIEPNIFFLKKIRTQYFLDIFFRNRIQIK